jgi:hypothetical protein
MMSIGLIMPHDTGYYDRELLYQEVWNEPLVKVVKCYGVSNVAIAKTCRKMRIPPSLLTRLKYWKSRDWLHSLPTRESPALKRIRPQASGNLRSENQVDP